MLKFSIYVLYQRPKDFPQGYVVRRWEVDKSQPFGVPQEIVDRGEDAEFLRWNLQKKGLTKLERFDNDDPCILETWV